MQTQPREGPCGWAGGLELSRVRVPAAETLQAQAPVSQADAGPGLWSCSRERRKGHSGCDQLLDAASPDLLGVPPAHKPGL